MEIKLLPEHLHVILETQDLFLLSYDQEEEIWGFKAKDCNTLVHV
jgi:hypothetical protein